METAEACLKKKRQKLLQQNKKRKKARCEAILVVGRKGVSVDP